jgi:hypothetical protein
LLLTAEQQRRAERVLRRRGVRCEQCGSNDFSSNGTAIQNIANISIPMYCNNPRDVNHPQGLLISRASLPISDDEASEIGIPVRRSTPSRRPPGGTAPMA